MYVVCYVDAPPRSAVKLMPSRLTILKLADRIASCRDAVIRAICAVAG